VQQIYSQELGGGKDKPPLLRRVMLLEVSYVVYAVLELKLGSVLPVCSTVP
jgi:hypothetical protein